MAQPLLFLVADTGGGHRAAAGAVARELSTRHPDRFVTHILDPFADAAPAAVGRLIELYSPLIRRAPWVWGALYHLTDSATAARALSASLLRLVEPGLRDMLRSVRPAVVVSFHPLLNHCCAHTMRRDGLRVPMITVVTDLVDVHATWLCAEASMVVTASAAARDHCRRAGMPGDRCVTLGLPVDSSFAGGATSTGERRELRTRLGLDADRFTVLLTGGGEGSGGLLRRARALTGGGSGILLVVICGRNTMLAERLGVLDRDGGTRVVVRGFVENMADWMRSADVVVTKAGPGTIAEALSCGVPLLLTAHLPGQERGNIDYVLATGTGRYVPRVRDLVDAVAELSRPGSAALAAMRRALAVAGHPDAAAHTADLVARLAGPVPP